MFRVDSSKTPVVVKLIDKSYIKALTAQVTNILFAQEDGQMEVKAFKAAFEKAYDKELDIEQLGKDLPDMVEVLENKPANEVVFNLLSLVRFFDIYF